MPRASARSRGRVAALLSLTLLAYLLGGCGSLLKTPVLEVNPTYLDLDSRSLQGAVTLANTGSVDSTLSFTVTSPDTRVAALPFSGNVAGGTTQSINLQINDSALAIGESISTTLDLSSNGGQASVSLNYVKTVGGLSACGTFPTLRGGSPLHSSTARGPVEPVQGAVPGQLLVGYADPLAPQARMATAAARSLAVAVRYSYDLQRIAAVDNATELVYTTDPDAVLERLRADPRVRFAERNTYVELQFVPNDTFYASEQWNLTRFGLEAAWDIEAGDSNDVVVAIIDSGVQMNHPDLVGKMLPGCDFNGNDNDPNPGAPYTSDASHGTHVAGIAAATGNNGIGVAGVAMGSKVRIVPVKIFDDTGTRATVDQLARAIRWSAGVPIDGVAPNPNPAHIINMSLGVPGTFQTLNEASADAWAAGALLVAAAGNHFGPQSAAVMSPANSSYVMAVGSVDADGSLSAFSNTGPELEVVAPGGLDVPGSVVCDYVLSTMPPDRYGCEAGTSMAAPFVAGQAALLKSQQPNRSNQDLRDRITTTTLPGAGTADEFGHGLACVDLALGATSRCGEPYTP